MRSPIVLRNLIERLTLSPKKIQHLGGNMRNYFSLQYLNADFKKSNAIKMWSDQEKEY